MSASPSIIAHYSIMLLEMAILSHAILHGTHVRTGSRGGETAFDVMIADCGVVSTAKAGSRQAASASAQRRGLHAAAMQSRAQCTPPASSFWGSMQLRR